MTTRALFVTLFVVLVVSLACQSKEIVVGEIRVEPDARLRADQTATLTINASGEDLVFEWKVSRGTLSSTDTPAVVYTAPDVPGVDTVTVTVKNRSRSVVKSTTLDISGSGSPPGGVHSVPLGDLAIPAGWMSGDRDPERWMDLTPLAGGCPGEGDCYRVSHTRGSGWTGIYWWPPACGAEGDDGPWERVKNGDCGVDVLQAGGFRKIRKLLFSARGGAGGERVRFKVGAPDVTPSPGASCRRSKLGSDWEQYEIDLESVDLSDAIALFGWTIEDARNPSGAVFEIADIRFEGES